MAGGWSKQYGGDKEFFKFQTPGDELIGTWLGTKNGKYGQNGLVKKKDDGEVAEFTLNTAIEDLVQLDKGTGVRIVYTGKKTSKGGNQFKAFDVFIWDDAKDKDDEVSDFTGPGGGEGREGDFQAGDEDVPF